MASDVVRNYTGWRIDRGNPETLTAGWNQPAVMLPTLMLNDVHSLTVDGELVDPDSFTFSENGVIRWAGFPAPVRRRVTAVVDHGYADVPREIQAVVFAAVARVVVNPMGIRSMNLPGGYSEVYTVPVSGETPGLSLLNAEKRILDRYRIFR